MKKGLLGLLVVALTMVGCQNYDDQFDDLNSKISSLATTVDGLLSVQTTVSALSTKLDNLASTALTDSDLAGILTEVAAVKQSVADLSLADDLAGIETEVADLDAEVDQILENLEEVTMMKMMKTMNIMRMMKMMMTMKIMMMKEEVLEECFNVKILYIYFNFLPNFIHKNILTVNPSKKPAIH